MAAEVPALVVLDVHRAWAWFVIFGNAAAGLWALAAHQWPAVRTKVLWWLVGVVQVAVFVQVVLGVVLVAHNGLVAPQFHMFYGFVALMAIAIIYSYRLQIAQYRYLLYGGGGLFLMGLGIRAMLLGPR